MSSILEFCIGADLSQWFPACRGARGHKGDQSRAAAARNATTNDPESIKPPRPREASNRGTEQSKTVRVPPTPKLGLAKAGPALAEAAHRVQKRWEPATPKAQAAI